MLPPVRRTQLSYFINNISIEMEWCEYAEFPPGYQKLDRRNPDSLLLFPMEGTLHAAVGGKWGEVGPGGLVLVPDQRPHSIHFPVSRRTRPCKMVSIYLQACNVWKLPFLSLFTSSVLKVRPFGYWRRNIIKLVSLFAQDRKLAQRLGSILLGDLFAFMLLDGNEIQIPKAAIDPRIVKSLQTIHESQGEDITIESLSQAVQLSSVHFRKLFSKALKVSPKSYIREFRFKTAARLLQRTSLSVKEIAFQTGFNTDHYFHNQFKKHYGMTPSEFRAQMVSRLQEGPGRAFKKRASAT